MKAVKGRPEGLLPSGFRVRVTFLHVNKVCLIPSSHEVGAQVEIKKTKKDWVTLPGKHHLIFFVQLCYQLSLTTLFKGLLELCFLIAWFQIFWNCISGLIKNSYICLFLVGSRSNYKICVSLYWLGTGGFSVLSVFMNKVSKFGLSAFLGKLMIWK